MARTRRKVPHWVDKRDQELIRAFRNGHAPREDRLRLKGVAVHSVEWHITSPQGKSAMKKILARKQRRKSKQRRYGDAAEWCL